MAVITAVSLNRSHTFSKSNALSIRLIEGLGVEGDAHSGKTVKHRSRLNQVPLPPNLRQVHLIHSELFDELRSKGFDVAAGQLGENITTRGIELLKLPTGALLRLGSSAVIEVTGLRNPCVQIDRFKKGMMKAVLDRDSHGQLLRKAGVMSIVRIGGDVHVNDEIDIELPARPHRGLVPV
jgi:MOSC domain-containing protein YiiM